MNQQITYCFYLLMKQLMTHDLNNKLVNNINIFKIWYIYICVYLYMFIYKNNIK